VAWDAFIRELADWLDERGFLVPRRRWVLGVSGGSDSTLLTHAMHAVNSQRGLSWRLELAHLHHGLRGKEADEDVEFVRKLAEEFGLNFHAERVDLGSGEAGKGASEEVAREHRYAFLERIALKTGSEVVAVGHHADDDAETIFHRILRGTGLRGLAGMSVMRPLRADGRVQLVRPLLHQRRARIESLLEAQGIVYRTDSTNSENNYTRNLIRNELLPAIRRDINPNVTEAIIRLAEQARWLGTYLQDAAARTFDSLVLDESPRHVVLSAPVLLGKQRIIQAEVIRIAASLVIGGEQDLGFNHIEAVLELAAEKQSGKEVHLPGPVAVRKQYDRVEFRPLSDARQLPELTPMFVNCPGQTRLAALEAELEIHEEIVDASKIDALREENSPFEEWLDFERVLPPLFVRGRQEGDRFHPLGAPGAKTLSEFFIDEKIDPAKRARTGILCDQAGPIWVMPLRIDERVKLRPRSRRALRLNLRARGASPLGS
jgi:tRNA(Ile)-lysidine synthase